MRSLVFRAGVGVFLSVAVACSGGGDSEPSPDQPGQPGQPGGPVGGGDAGQSEGLVLAAVQSARRRGHRRSQRHARITRTEPRSACRHVSRGLLLLGIVVVVIVLLGAACKPKNNNNSNKDDAWSDDAML